MPVSPLCSKPRLAEFGAALMDRIADPSRQVRLKTARLLAKMPPELAAEARQLAYRLYSICDRKGWAEQARAYNNLVVSWPAIQERATQTGVGEQTRLLDTE